MHPHISAHIGECLVLMGKLVEAQEAYETLIHRELPADAPEPFREAVASGKRELAELAPRVPKLRIEVTPPPSTLRNLVVYANDKPLPAEVIGIARPVNPGTYRISATTAGLAPSRPVEVQLGERETKSVLVVFGRR